MNIIINNRLTEEERYIRETVFVFEQGFNEEFDTLDNDNNCIHFLVYIEDKAVATARVFYNNEHSGYSIGRYAVLKEYRGKGIGAYLMKEIEKYLFDKYGHISVGLSSQKRAIGFYEKQGYKQIGEFYLDEGYPHIYMIKEL